MQIITIPIAELRRPEKNVRIHTELQITEFVRSLEMFGQIRPVVIDEDNVILAGNGLVEALTRRGSETAQAYQITGLSENQKKKLMIADNKIFSLGIENLETLDALLHELNGDLDVPGFDEDILQSMVADAAEVTETLSTYGTLDEDEIQRARESAARKEERLAATPEVSSAEPTSVPVQGTDQSPSPNRGAIICPKCGEEIWL